MSQVIKAMHLKYPNQEIKYENDKKKYELKMSDDDYFEFYHLWENSVIYSLAYDRNGFGIKTYIETANEELFQKKMPTGLYLGLYFIFCPD